MVCFFSGPLDFFTSSPCASSSSSSSSYPFQLTTVPFGTIGSFFRNVVDCDGCPTPSDAKLSFAAFLRSFVAPIDGGYPFGSATNVLRPVDSEFARLCRGTALPPAPELANFLGLGALHFPNPSSFDQCYVFVVDPQFGAGKLYHLATRSKFKNEKFAAELAEKIKVWLGFDEVLLDYKFIHCDRSTTRLRTLLVNTLVNTENLPGETFKAFPLVRRLEFDPQAENPDVTYFTELAYLCHQNPKKTLFQFVKRAALSPHTSGLLASFFGKRKTEASEWLERYDLLPTPRRPVSFANGVDDCFDDNGITSHGRAAALLILRGERHPRFRLPTPAEPAPQQHSARRERSLSPKRRKSADIVLDADSEVEPEPCKSADICLIDSSEDDEKLDFEDFLHEEEESKLDDRMSAECSIAEEPAAEPEPEPQPALDDRMSVECSIAEEPAAEPEAEVLPTKPEPEPQPLDFLSLSMPLPLSQVPDLVLDLEGLNLDDCSVPPQETSLFKLLTANDSLSSHDTLILAAYFTSGITPPQAWHWFKDRHLLRLLPKSCQASVSGYQNQQCGIACTDASQAHPCFVWSGEETTRILKGIERRRNSALATKRRRSGIVADIEPKQRSTRDDEISYATRGYHLTEAGRQRALDLLDGAVSKKKKTQRRARQPTAADVPLPENFGEAMAPVPDSFSFVHRILEKIVAIGPMTTEQVLADAETLFPECGPIDVPALLEELLVSKTLVKGLQFFFFLPEQSPVGQWNLLRRMQYQLGTAVDTALFNKCWDERVYDRQLVEEKCEPVSLALGQEDNWTSFLEPAPASNLWMEFY